MCVGYMFIRPYLSPTIFLEFSFALFALKWPLQNTFSIATRIHGWRWFSSLQPSVFTIIEINTYTQSSRPYRKEIISEKTSKGKVQIILQNQEEESAWESKDLRKPLSCSCPGRNAADRSFDWIHVTEDSFLSITVSLCSSVRKRNWVWGLWSWLAGRRLQAESDPLVLNMWFFTSSDLKA